MSHLSQDNHGYPRLSQACLCVSPVPGQTWTSQVVPDMLMCPTCPRTTMDIPGCPMRAQDKHGHPRLSQTVSHLSQDKNGHPRLSLACSGVPPVPRQPWTSQVVPGMLMCPTCPKTTMDIQGCPWYAPWTPPSLRSKTSHLSQDNCGHPRLSLVCSMGTTKSQVQVVPSVPGQLWTSQVVPGMVYGTTKSQVQVVPSVPGQLGASQVVPSMLLGHHQVPGPSCPICPRATRCSPPIIILSSV